MLPKGASNDASHLRPLKCELSVISRADGSCSFQQGHTSVIVGVNGPIDTKVSKQLIDEARVDCFFYPKIGGGASSEATSNVFSERISNIVSNCLCVKQYPRCAVEISVVEIQNDGCLFSTLVNAACLALLDCGVSMQSLFAAVTACIDAEGNLHLDPSDALLQNAISTIDIVYESKTNNMIASQASGAFTPENFLNCFEAGKRASERLFSFYRNTMKRKFRIVDDQEESMN